MDSARLNRRMFEWAYRQAIGNVKNLIWKTRKFFKQNDLNMLLDRSTPMLKHIAVKNVSKVAFNIFLRKWENEIVQEKSKGKNGKNKLRMYKNFKTVFCTEQYVQAFYIGRKAKIAFTKFRCGIAPINIEIGRYKNLPVEERLCPFCPECIEDEVHVITCCPLYDDVRNELYDFIKGVDVNFELLNNIDKTIYILSGYNGNILKKCANMCDAILKRRQLFVK